MSRRAHKSTGPGRNQKYLCDHHTSVLCSKWALLSINQNQNHTTINNFTVTHEPKPAQTKLACVRLRNIPFFMNSWVPQKWVMKLRDIYIHAFCMQNWSRTQILHKLVCRYAHMKQCMHIYSKFTWEKY